jgi:hypothetical protein
MHGNRRFCPSKHGVKDKCKNDYHYAVRRAAAKRGTAAGGVQQRAATV